MKRTSPAVQERELEPKDFSVSNFQLNDEISKKQKNLNHTGKREKNTDNHMCC